MLQVRQLFYINKIFLLLVQLINFSKCTHMKALVTLLKLRKFKMKDKNM